MSAVSTSCCNSYGLVVVGWPVFQQCQMSQHGIDTVDALVLHRYGHVKNSYYLRTVLNITTLLSTKYCQNWLMNVKAIPNQSSVVFTHEWKDPISGVRVSPGSAETLVRRGKFNSVLTQQHLCRKLPKSVDVRSSYIVQHQCCFLRRSNLKNVHILFI